MGDFDKLKGLNVSSLSGSKYSREDLAGYILELRDEISAAGATGGGSALSLQIVELTSELRETRQTVKDFKSQLDIQTSENKAMKSQMEKMVNTISCHQIMLENLDYQQRECKIVVKTSPKNTRLVLQIMIRRS